MLIYLGVGKYFVNFRAKFKIIHHVVVYHYIEKSYVMLLNAPLHRKKLCNGDFFNNKSKIYEILTYSEVDEYF